MALTVIGIVSDVKGCNHLLYKWMETIALPVQRFLGEVANSWDS